MTHPAEAVLPPEWPTVTLGGKRLELRYSHRSKVVVGERHGSLNGFLRDLALSASQQFPGEKIQTTVLLAGLVYRDEFRDQDEAQDLLDELVGTNFGDIDTAAEIGFKAMYKAYGWSFLEDDDEGEAEAGADDETPAEKTEG